MKLRIAIAPGKGAEFASSVHILCCGSDYNKTGVSANGPIEVDISINYSNVPSSKTFDAVYLDMPKLIAGEAFPNPHPNAVATSYIKVVDTLYSNLKR